MRKVGRSGKPILIASGISSNSERDRYSIVCAAIPLATRVDLLSPKEYPASEFDRVIFLTGVGARTLLGVVRPPTSAMTMSRRSNGQGSWPAGRSPSRRFVRSALLLLSPFPNRIHGANFYGRLTTQPIQRRE